MPTPLTLLIVSNVHWWNAEAAYAAVTAEILQKAGHKVFVLTRPNTVNEQELLKRNLPLITHIDLNTYNIFKLYQSYHQLKKLLQEKKIDVVNAHRSEGLILFILLKRHLKSFKLVRTRGTTRPVRKAWSNRKIYQEWTDAHIFAGKIVFERLTQAIALSQKYAQTIYYPIDQQAPPLDKIDYYQEFEIPRDYLVLAIVGRISPVKGHELLLEAFQKVLATRSDVILLICYKHPDPERPELKALKQRSHEMGIIKNVRFLGPRKDIRAIMEFVDLGIVSSLDSEVICRVAVEFFSMGTPIVACPTGCLPELVFSGKTGTITKSASPKDLSDAILHTIADKSDLAELGKRAQQYAREHFSQELFLQKTMSVFQSVLSPKPN